MTSPIRSRPGGPRSLRRFMAPSLMVVLGTTALTAVELHGFVSQGYLNSSGNNAYEETLDGTWAFNEMGFNVSQQLTDQLRIGMQLFARDLGDVGNNQVIIDWAYADYRHSDAIGISIGRYKVPTGLYNEVRDLDLATTFILLPESAYDIRYRDFAAALNGVQLYGILPLGPIGKLDYQLFAGTMNIDDDSYLAKSFESSIVTTVDELGVDGALGLALTWRPPVEGLRCMGSVMDVRGARVAGTLVVAPFPVPPVAIDTTIDDMYVATAGAEYAVNEWVFAAEYAVRYANPPGFPGVDTRIRNDGGYVMASYRFHPSWEVGSYYSVSYANRNDRDGDRIVENPATNTYRHNAWQKDLAVSLRWDIDGNWLVKIEAHVIDGTANLLTSENPQPYEQDWWLFAAKTTFSF